MPSTSTELVRDPDVSKLFRAAGLIGDISLVVPDNATLESVETTLSIAIGGYKRLAQAAEKLKPIIGRLLLIVESRRLFKPQYKNFTHFVMERIVKEMDFPRTNAFEALRIARAFPSLTAEEYTSIGATRLLEAVKHTDEKHENYREILTDVARMPLDQFREKMKQLAAASSPSAAATAPDTSKVIQIRVNETLYDRWQKTLREAGTQSAASVLGQMIDLWDKRPNKATKRTARAA